MTGRHGGPYWCDRMRRHPLAAGTAFALLVAGLTLAGCGWLRGVRGGGPAPIDLNLASIRRIERLPGITPSLAGAIVKSRPYGEPRDLVDRGILTQRELDRLEGLVTVETGR